MVRSLAPGLEKNINKSGPRGVHAVTGADLGPCWVWTRSLVAGYGQCSFKVYGESRVHRVVWKALRGPIAPGLVLDHLCRNRACCNPDHLEPVTEAVNYRRGARAGALGRMHAAKTHCPAGHLLEGGNVYLTKNRNGSSSRNCKACKRAEWHRRQARKAVA